MASGKIVKVNEKGFGFIQPDEAGARDIFFHVSGLKNRAEFDGLQAGDPVAYATDSTGDRPRAIDVEKKQ